MHVNNLLGAITASIVICLMISTAQCTPLQLLPNQVELGVADRARLLDPNHVAQFRQNQARYW